VLSGVSEEVMTDLKEDTLRLYRLSLKDKKEDETIINLIESSDYKTLKGLHSQYDQLSEDTAGISCSDCGSNNVSRGKAKPGKEEDEFQVPSNTSLIGSVTGKRKGTYVFSEKRK